MDYAETSRPLEVRIQQVLMKFQGVEFVDESEAMSRLDDVLEEDGFVVHKQHTGPFDGCKKIIVHVQIASEYTPIAIYVADNKGVLYVHGMEVDS